MTLLFALVVGLLFGTGTILMLHRNLIQVVAGTLVISNASILFIMVATRMRGQAPIYPILQLEAVSDPLVQALALTAVVISFGVTALLLSIVYRVALHHESLAQEDIVAQEAREFQLVAVDEEEEVF